MDAPANRVVEDLRRQNWRYDQFPELYHLILSSLPFGPSAAGLSKLPIGRAADIALRSYGEPRPRDWHHLLTAIFDELCWMKLEHMAKPGWEDEA